MSYFKGYKYHIEPSGNGYRFTIWHNGGVTAEGYAKTHNSALTKIRRLVNLFTSK